MAFLLALPALFAGASATAAGAGAAAATAGAGAAAAGAGAAAAGGITLTQVLSGVATVGSIFSTIAAGAAEAESLKNQAWEAQMQKGQEQIESVRRTTDMKRELARVLGENDVAYSAAGIDISSGVAAQGRATAETRAAQEVSIDRDQTAARGAMYDARSSMLRGMARRRMATAVGSAAMTGFQSFATMAGKAA